MKPFARAGYRVESVSQFEFSMSHSHQSKLSKNRSIFGGSAIFQRGYAVFRHFFAAGLFLPYLICIFTFLSCDHNNQNGFCFTRRSKSTGTTSNQTILKERLVNLLLESKPTNTVEQLYLVIEQCFS